MSSKQYRSTNRIILTILEEIIRGEMQDGILKSHLITQCKLKSSTAEKYLIKLENAGYIYSNERSWGERDTIVFKITDMGIERYKWFLKISTELE